uniref:Uncharacterized protein n=1 Tax=Anas platyrhynchos platyrhynchos TaxID=8840 RepID=A0A493TJG7_ANAPP
PTRRRTHPTTSPTARAGCPCTPVSHQVTAAPLGTTVGEVAGGDTPGRPTTSPSSLVGNLDGELGAAERTVEDVFLRKFFHGTFPGCLADEVVLKRRANALVGCLLLLPHLAPAKQPGFLRLHYHLVVQHQLLQRLHVGVEGGRDEQRLVDLGEVAGGAWGGSALAP